MKLKQHVRRVLIVAFVVVIPMVCINTASAQKMSAVDKAKQAEEAAKQKALKNKIAESNMAEIQKPNLNIAHVNSATKSTVRASAERIDQIIDADLAKKGLKPNENSTDEQFVRRIYLDTVGTIPSGRRAWNFLKTDHQDKRSIMIDYLMNQPGYASHMYNYWADILRVVDKPNGRVYLRPYAEWLKDSFRKNTPYNKMVHQMLTAEGKAWEDPAAGYKLRDSGMPLDNLNATIRIFLGTRIGCAQCHDHPFDRWTQKEFYQLAAFESGVRTGIPPKSTSPVNAKLIAQAKKAVGPKKQGRLNEVSGMNRNIVFEYPNVQLRYPKDYHYDNAKPNEVVKPNVIFGEMPKLDGTTSRRKAFADWLTSKDNPRFAKAVANRMWKRAMGVGLIEPVDDMQDDTKASIPELMDYLTAELKRLDFNLKEFQRIIYHTRAYQRKVNYDGFDRAKVYNFTGPALRRMTAEQVWDSLLTLSLKAPDVYIRPDDDVFITAVKADANTSVDALAAKVDELTEAYTTMRKEEYEMSYKGVILRRASELQQPLPPNHFLRQFGLSDREIIADGTTEGTVPQLLTLFNGPVTHMMLEAGSVVHSELMATNAVDDRVRIIFLSVLGRLPTTEEMQQCKDEYRRVRMEGYGNIVWALLNTREFLFIQ